MDTPRLTGPDFRAAFEEHKDSIYRFAWRMTASESDAEDIAQDVFLSLLEQPERFDASRGQLRSFLFAVARNLARKFWRREKRWDALEDEHFIVQPLDIEKLGVGEAVGVAFQALPPLQREVLILAHYEELSLEEIARTVDSSVGAVKARLHRARANLKKILAPLKHVHERSSCPDATAGR